MKKPNRLQAPPLQRVDYALLRLIPDFPKGERTKTIVTCGNDDEATSTAETSEICLRNRRCEIRDEFSFTGKDGSEVARHWLIFAGPNVSQDVEFSLADKMHRFIGMSITAITRYTFQVGFFSRGFEALGCSRAQEPGTVRSVPQS